nr:hypothetical protein [Desulfobacterales bacterium]
MINILGFRIHTSSFTRSNLFLLGRDEESYTGVDRKTGLTHLFLRENIIFSRKEKGERRREGMS